MATNKRRKLWFRPWWFVWSKNSKTLRFHIGIEWYCNTDLRRVHKGIFDDSRFTDMNAGLVIQLLIVELRIGYRSQKFLETTP